MEENTQSEDLNQQEKKVTPKVIRTPVKKAAAPIKTTVRKPRVKKEVVTETDPVELNGDITVKASDTSTTVATEDATAEDTQKLDKKNLKKLKKMSDKIKEKEKKAKEKQKEKEKKAKKKKKEKAKKEKTKKKLKEKEAKKKAAKKKKSKKK